jgi:2,3-dihydroxybenzoate decarboxylase
MAIETTRIVAIEEHYMDAEVAVHLAGKALAPQFRARLEDVGARRIQEMDEAGIDVQVLSHVSPGTQRLDPETAVRLARAANQRLHEAVSLHPARLAAFATLPTPDPRGAADELERTVTKLGFKGGMIGGLTNGRFIDESQFWPIFERAQALDVPLYVHPARPHPAVVEAYYKDYAERYPELLGAAWGFTVEAGTQAIRLVLSGVFEAYPKLKIILGHLGEGLPYLLWRIDESLARSGNLPHSFRDTFCRHFHVTTSGSFSDRALALCIAELGIERVIFAVDTPFMDSADGVRWARSLPLGAEDRDKILSANAVRLLRL